MQQLPSFLSFSLGWILVLFILMFVLSNENMMRYSCSDGLWRCYSLCSTWLSHQWHPGVKVGIYLITFSFFFKFVQLTWNSWILTESTCFCSSSLFCMSVNVFWFFCHSAFSLSKKQIKDCFKFGTWKATNQLQPVRNFFLFTYLRYSL